MRREIDKQFTDLRKTFDAILDSHDAMLAYLKTRSAPVDVGEVGRVLKNALDGKPGWGEEARRVLGLQRMISCEYCQTPFPSGGKRKKYCKDVCRFAAIGK